MTSFVNGHGTYYDFGPLQPRSTDCFATAGDSTPTAVLSGAKVVPTSGNSWQVDGSGDYFMTGALATLSPSIQSIAAGDDPFITGNSTQPACPNDTNHYPQGTTNPGLCDYPDLMFMDNTWLTRQVASSTSAPCPHAVFKSPEVAKLYCINYAQGRIYLSAATSPSLTELATHTFTYTGIPTDVPSGATLLQFAFQNANSASNATIEDLKVTQYANTDPVPCTISPPPCPSPPSGGASIQMGTGWIVGNELVSQVHGCAVMLGRTNATITGSTLRYNLEEGYCGPSVSGGSFTNDTVASNNVGGPAFATATPTPYWPDQFDIPNGGGGGKLSGTQSITVRGSSFKSNQGNGLWFDVASDNMTIENNVATGNIAVLGNGGDGIRIEVSCHFTIDKGTQAAANDVESNDHAGIDIVDSDNGTISGNTLVTNNAASLGSGGEIRIVAETRTSPPTPPSGCTANDSSGVAVSSNIVTMSSPDQVGLVDHNCSPCNFGTGSTASKFTADQYHHNCGLNLWVFKTDGSTEVPFTTWQGDGEDTSPQGSCSNQ